MRKILLSLLIIAVVASVAAVGISGAWFSDTETSADNTFTAGTLDLKIADNNEGWNDGEPVTASWQSPAGWAPGETFTTGTISLYNVGSIDINYLFTTFYDYTCTGNDLGQVIEVVEYWEYIPEYDWIQNIGPTDGQNLETLVGDKTAPLTLRELVDASWEGDTTWIDYCTGDGYDIVPDGTPAIPVGGTYQVYLVLKLMETAENQYQGASCSFNIEFEGVQDAASQKH
ncbi:MAG: SipW-dependent-type signal peptide-containing protein [Chloroflexota bacterium]|nr:SipW-dependent-type signal peptide-containing protein [Chloroflexota bacterium]